MKELVTDYGGRRLYNEDLLNLQELALANAEFFNSLGKNLIISGCDITFVEGVTDRIVNISEGYAFITGKLRHVEPTSIHVLAGYNGPFYIVPTTKDGPNILYASGMQKKMFVDYGSQFTATEPTTNIGYVYIKNKDDKSCKFDTTLFNQQLKTINGISIVGEGNINIPAGVAGKDGKDGVSPTIGENGNWWFGDIDTGIKAVGKDGVSTQIKGSLNNVSELATAPKGEGFSYLIDGYLWVYTGTTQVDSTHQHGYECVGRIQGPEGPRGQTGATGADGQNGTDGRDGAEITGFAVEYAWLDKSITSASTIPASTQWSETLTYVEGKNLWKRFKMTWKNRSDKATTTYTTPAMDEYIARIGSKTTYIGPDGIYTGTLAADVIAAIKIAAAQVNISQSLTVGDALKVENDLIKLGSKVRITWDQVTGVPSNIQGQPGASITDAVVEYILVDKSIASATTVAGYTSWSTNPGYDASKNLWTRYKYTWSGRSDGKTTTYSTPSLNEYISRIGSLTTYIGANGLYTGTIAADHITGLSIAADKITAGKLNANVELQATKGTIGGWDISADGLISKNGSTTVAALNADGSGSLANGNITWAPDGTFNIKGALIGLTAAEILLVRARTTGLSYTLRAGETISIPFLACNVYSGTVYVKATPTSNIQSYSVSLKLTNLETSATCSKSAGVRGNTGYVENGYISCNWTLDDYDENIERWGRFVPVSAQITSNWGDANVIIYIN